MVKFKQSRKQIMVSLILPKNERNSLSYRVFHIEMFLLKCLWQTEICKLDLAWRYLYIPEAWKFEFHQPVF